MPYSGLSSYDEAYKKARLFIDNLKLQETDEIRVLEVGAGYGEFARNFITAMRDISERENLPYYDKLSYYISDFSQRTIDELRASGRLKAEEEAGKIHYAVYDTLDNASLRLQNIRFNLILANYLLDQFHVRVFVRSQGKYFEKYIALYDDQKRVDKYLAGRPERKWIKRIRKRHQFREVDLGDEIPALHFELLRSCFRFGAGASAVSYPYEALKVLENWLALLAPAGIIVVSDFNCASKSGYDALEPCYYGNSLAEGVNFDFITKYFSYSKFRDAMVEALDSPSGTRMKSGQQLALLYEDPVRPLHTLILTNNDFAHALELGESYQRVYMSNWLLRMFYKVMREIQVGSWIYALIVLGFLVYGLIKP